MAETPNTSFGTMDEAGRVGGRWCDMGLAADWLAGRLANRGQGLTVNVVFRPDRSIPFHYPRNNQRTPIFLLVGTTRSAPATNTRFGALVAPPEVPGPLAQALVAHTAASLAAVFPQSIPAWLQRRAEPLNQILWGGGSFLANHFANVLLPGVTRWKDCLFASEEYSFEEGLELVCSGEPDLRMFIQPLAPNPPPHVVGRYGPLVLSVPQPGWLRHPLANFVGYLLSLAVPDGAVLTQCDDTDSDWDRNLDASLTEDAFLLSTFFSCDEIARALCASDCNAATITNMARDCASCLHHTTGPVEHTRLDLWHIPSSRKYLDSFHVTDLSDVEALSCGAEPKVADLVNQAILAKADVILVQGGCAGLLMGDDVAQAMRNAVIDHPGPFLAVNMESCLNQQTNDYARFWDHLVGHWASRSGPIRPRTVNLVGYGDWKATPVQELVALLSQFGIHEVCCLLPSFRMQSLAEFTSAELTLVYPSPHVRISFEQARKHCRGKVMEIPAPWGVAGTLSWLNSVLGALDLPVLDPMAQEALVQRYVPQNWKGLTREEGQSLVAFVASAAYASTPEAPVRHGAHLPALFHELGFALELALLPPSKGRERRLSRLALARWGLNNGASTTRPLSGLPQETLDQLLSRLKASVVYSEWEGDERVLRSGRVPLSISDLEMGLAGAVRNRSRLQTLTSLPFSRSYRPYMCEEIPHG